MHGDTRLVSSLPCKNKLLTVALKKYAKTDIKDFRSCLTLRDFLIFLKIFYIDCSYVKKCADIRKMQIY